MRNLMLLTASMALLVMMFATVAYAKTIIGTNENDNIRGTSRGDQINALGGQDNVRGKLGADDLYGGRGNDQLVGGLDDDDLTGGLGFDYLVGDYGDDTFFASDGVADYIEGGPGIDRAWVDELDLQWGVAPDVEYVNGKKYTPPQAIGPPVGTLGTQS